MVVLTFDSTFNSENYDYAMSWLSVDWRDNLWVTSSCDSNGGGGDGDGGSGPADCPEVLMGWSLSNQQLAAATCAAGKWKWGFHRQTTIGHWTLNNTEKCSVFTASKTHMVTTFGHTLNNQTLESCLTSCGEKWKIIVDWILAFCALGPSGKRRSQAIKHRLARNWDEWRSRAGFFAKPHPTSVSFGKTEEGLGTISEMERHNIVWVLYLSSPIVKWEETKG